MTGDQLQWLAIALLLLSNFLSWAAHSGHDSRMDRIQGLRRQ